MLSFNMHLMENALLISAYGGNNNTIYLCKQRHRVICITPWHSYWPVKTGFKERSNSKPLLVRALSIFHTWEFPTAHGLHVCLQPPSPFVAASVGVSHCVVRVSNSLPTVPDTEQVFSTLWAVGWTAAILPMLCLSTWSSCCTRQAGLEQRRGVSVQWEREADGSLTIIIISSLICFSCTNSESVMGVAAPRLTATALGWDPRGGGRGRIPKKFRSLSWFLFVPG